MNTYGGTETVLTIRGSQKEDAGQYQCVAKNSYGDAQQNVFLEIAERPNFLQCLMNKLVPTGKSIRLDCRIDGKPEPEVKWMKVLKHCLATVKSNG